MKPHHLSRVLGASILGALVLALSPAVSAQSASAYVASGTEKSRNGDYDGAISDFSQALDLNSSYLGAYTGRGMAKTQQGNFDGAIADYSAAIKLKPTLTEAYLHRAHAEFLQGNFDGAILDYTKVLNQKPDSQSAYFHRGLAHECQTDDDGASMDLEKALTLKGSAGEDAGSYILLYNGVVGRRTSHPIDERLKSNSGWTNEWTKLLAMFLADQMSEDDLMKRAGNAGGDDKDRQMGEALYFTGAVRLLKGDKAGAKANFQKCFDSTGPAMLVHRLARTELDRG